ncbi:MAG: GNAT family N-acetyltransferase [Bacteroidales bacterium]
MQSKHFTIRVMTRAEVDIAIEWAALEGWNPGLYDAECFYQADPNGFLIGLLEGVPIAAISAVKYSHDFGFLGFYMVRPEYRGFGYGIQMWNAGMANLKGCTIGLDGVIAQQENYRKSGFKLAYRNIRYQGFFGGNVTVDSGILPLFMVPFDELCRYDRMFFPAERATFLRCWIYQPQSTAVGILQNGRLAGYGIIRDCRTGYKTGPLFADTPEQAEQLFEALIANVPEASPVFIDIPEANPAAISLVNQHNMTPSFETARMYTGIAPELPVDRIFGVTSFELG